MREIYLDGRRMTSREGAHMEIGVALHFPAYYGRNLDALHDCLTDIAEPTHLFLLHANRMREGLGGYAMLLLRVLEDAARENPNFSMTVLDA